MQSRSLAHTICVAPEEPLKFFLMLSALALNLTDVRFQMVHGIWLRNSSIIKHHVDALRARDTASHRVRHSAARLADRAPATISTRFD
jgi:hypothetical protein